jgi:hypothetical protein
MPLDPETVAQAIGLALVESHARTDRAMGELEARGDERRTAAIGELWNRVAADLNDLEQRLAEEIAARFVAMVERMAAELAALPAPQPGADGRDGVDRILALPRAVRAEDNCQPNEIATAAGGLWQSVRVTSGGPEQDPAGWKCLVPGFAGFRMLHDWERRELVFEASASDGRTHESRARMAPTTLPPDYLDRGWGVLEGDRFRPEGGEVELVALRDGARLGEAGDWQEIRLRGFRGQRGLPGEKGDRGPPGPGLVGLDVVRGDDGAKLLVPRFSDPSIRAEPIAIEILLPSEGSR